MIKIAKEANMDSNVYIAAGIGFVTALVFYAMSEVSVFSLKLMGMRLS